MSWLDLVVLSLASGAVLQAWFRGSIFAAPRAYMEARTSPPFDNVADDIQEADEPLDDLVEASRPLWVRIADRIVPQLLAEGVTCPLCLSYHVPWLLMLGSWGGAALAIRLWPVDAGETSLLWRDLLVCVLRAPAWSLAATRLANIIDSVLPPRGRHAPSLEGRGDN